MAASNIVPSLARVCSERLLWISNQELVQALDVTKIVISKPEELEPVPKTEELSLFREYAEFS